MSRGFLDLSELSEFTASAVENDTVSFIATYEDGRVFTCNRALCRLTGYSKQEISEMRWPEDFTPAEHRVHATDIIKGVYCNVAPYRYEMEFIRKDGSRVPVDVYVHRFCDKKGATMHYYSFITDMSDHKKLEDALRKSEAKYRELVENANSIVLKIDTDGNVKFFNEFAQNFFGYKLDEILDKNLVGTIVPETESSGRDLSEMIRDICIHPARYQNNENENIRSNGERVWVSWTNKAVYDDQGNIIGILCVGNDITALKDAETELKRSRDELEVRVKERTSELEKANTALIKEMDARQHIEKEIIDSEEKFRTLVEMSPIAILFHRGDRFIYANPAAEEIVGYSTDRILKTKFWELFAPEYREIVKERGLSRLRGEKPPARYEVRLHTKGEEKWMVITSARVMYKGRPAILSAGLDMTQYKQVLTALRDAKAEAELYVDLMGHDISNINQVGLGSLELLKEVATLSGTEEELASKAMSAFMNSSELIDKVRKLQKVKKGDMRLEKIDIGPILDRVKNNYLKVPGRQVTINLEPQKGCFVLADMLLYDVFSNIVDNSIKHSKGPVEVNISLSRVKVDDKELYQVSIEDNGPGISPDLKNRIFNRLYYEGGVMKGKGLGLYLVKTLAERFNGSIRVEDRIQGDHTKGARLVVMLPAAE